MVVGQRRLQAVHHAVVKQPTLQGEVLAEILQRREPHREQRPAGNPPHQAGFLPRKRRAAAAGQGLDGRFFPGRHGRTYDLPVLYLLPENSPADPSVYVPCCGDIGFAVGVALSRGLR